MLHIRIDLPKAPRWISTEAGLWAWQSHDPWRANATNALSVRERHQLLQEAERLRGSAGHSVEQAAG
jgi:hypothetical protein